MYTNRRIFKNEALSPYALVLLVVMMHLPLMLLPSVNLEFAFADAAGYFSNGNRALIDQYFFYQANTLGMPWTAALTHGVFSSMPQIDILRLWSVAGIAFMGAGFLRISDYVGNGAKVVPLALLLLNPLIWPYAARATADFLPAAVGVFAVSLALGEGKEIRRTIATGVFLGIASILKYHELALSLLVFAMLWSRNPARRAWQISIGSTAIAAAMVLLYLVLAHANFGFWVTPDRYKEVHRLGSHGFFSNLVAYGGYLVMLAFPFSLIAENYRRLFVDHWKLIIPIAFGLVLFGACAITNNGEMNFGPFDRYVSPPLMSGIFMLISLGCLLPLLHGKSNSPDDRLRKAMAVAIVLILIVFSLSRPAQRYLMPLLAFFLAILPESAFRSRILSGTVLAVFVAVNAFVAYSQWCTGAVAEKMVRLIEDKGYLSVTDPGVMAGHVGNRFDLEHLSRARFIVVNGLVNGAIATAQSDFRFARKTYSLVPTTQ